jgi:hypothetical protein
MLHGSVDQPGTQKRMALSKFATVTSCGHVDMLVRLVYIENIVTNTHVDIAHMFSTAAFPTMCPVVYVPSIYSCACPRGFHSNQYLQNFDANRVQLDLDSSSFQQNINSYNINVNKLFCECESLSRNIFF